MRSVLAAVVCVAWLSVPGCASSGSLRLPPRSDDPGITNLIARRLTSDPKLCPYEITVIVVDRTARLEGKAASEAERGRAEQIARDAGATRVEDLLRVDPAAGQPARC